MTWGVFQEKELLRREPVIRDAFDWVSRRHNDISVVKTKTDVHGTYELYSPTVSFPLPYELRRVDPKGVIAWYPVAAMPAWKIDAESLNMAQVVRTRGKAELEYGDKATVILALLSVGWTEREIAKALDTSRTYVMNVRIYPRNYVTGVNA